MPRLADAADLQPSMRPVWPPADILAAVFDALDASSRYRLEERGDELFILEQTGVTRRCPSTKFASPFSKPPANDNSPLSLRLITPGKE